MSELLHSFLTMLAVNRPVGIDPTNGVGTAYNGVVKIPRPGGIRKGWLEQCVVVCDFKLFLYDMNPSRGNQASLIVNQVIDMRSVRHEPGRCNHTSLCRSSIFIRNLIVQVVKFIV